jgi:hypothetical protein
MLVAEELKAVNPTSDPELVSAAQSLPALTKALPQAKNTSRSRGQPASLTPTVAAPQLPP